MATGWGGGGERGEGPDSINVLLGKYANDSRFIFYNRFAIGRVALRPLRAEIYDAMKFAHFRSILRPGAFGLTPKSKRGVEKNQKKKYEIDRG